MKFKKLSFVLGILLVILINCNVVNADDYEKTCGNYTYVEYDGGAWIIGYDDGVDYDYDGEADEVIESWSIPSTLNGLQVVGIGDFSGYIDNVDGEYIDREYVSNIDALTKSVILPEGLVYIGSNTFSELDNIINVSIPTTVKTIRSWAFYKCSGLKAIVLPEGLEGIGYMAFNGCTSLEGITIPASVSEIGDYAFFDCWSATGIYVADSNEKYFDIDGVLCEVDSYVYTDANDVKHNLNTRVLAYPGGKSGTFTLQDDMYIDNTTFVNAKQLSGIEVDEGNPLYSSVDGVLYNKDKTRLEICPCAKTGKIEILDTVTKIGYSAFSYSSAKEIILPDAVSFVDSYAFYQCNLLESITIGKNLVNEEYTKSADYLLNDLKSAGMLKTIMISEENSYMTSIDNIVYSKDLTKILLCLDGKSGTYVMPDAVVSADSSMFYCGFNEITIGASYQGEVYDSSKLEFLHVSEQNPYMISVDNVVYSKDLTKILLCLDGKSGAYIMPNTIVLADRSMFYCGFNEITIGASYQEIICNSDDIKIFHVDAANPIYAENSGVIYSKDMKKLLCIPSGMSGTLLIPEGVEIIEDPYEIVYFDGIITIPKSVTNIATDAAFKASGSLVTIHGYTGSCAEQFANKYGIKFVPIIEELPPEPEKQEQIITVIKSWTKTYGNKAFNLNAKSNGDGVLTYQSSNTKVVKVNSKGKVTIKGTGKATITIEAPETEQYKAVTQKVTITVKPKQASIKKLSSPKKKTLKLTWKKDSKASGYQIVIATDKKFKKNKKVITVKSYKTVSKTITKLKSKKTYYVKIRSFKTSGKTKIYSTYSKVKKIKVK